MQIAFRTDASLDIGNGHVMRCLTLATNLQEAGATCRFICCDHPGNLIALIRERGFEVHTLPCHPAELPKPAAKINYAAWLGTDCENDARQTQTALGNTPVDWLIVDHYALDAHWEKQLRCACRGLMVIDDLANRDHDCDLLLDQNLGRIASDYAHRIPPECTLLIGPAYALLRPEFAEHRQYSLARRSTENLQHLLITMGGVDKDNATGKILAALMDCKLPLDCHITIVMGPHAPWLDQVRQQAEIMPRLTEILVNVNNMAELMADSDLAIGAAGSTAWERCCLGLPSIVLTLADNQKAGAAALASTGCSLLIHDRSTAANEIKQAIHHFMQAGTLLKSSAAAAAITDGSGAKRVQAKLLKHKEKAARVRPMQVQDLHTVLAWRNHPAIRQHMLTQHEISLEEHRAWFERSTQDPHKKCLIVEEENVALGYVYFSGVQIGATAEWGFYTAPDAPKGSGKKLGQASLDYAFNNLGLKKVAGHVLAANLGSIKFHQKLGFQSEDLLSTPQSSGNRNPELKSFVLTSEEWKIRQEMKHE
jgi:UDP-2,4-diacetamido-2,4,6-trideoxy-beta-L-altropyranose hydrolase/UDP-4-amino-4,6-dideoxy-N-acetyl-beta-L-altrosamine N-acetyltransferase